MKKNKLIYTLGLAVLCGLFSSCYEDLSTGATAKIGEVVIDTTGVGHANANGILELAQGATLSLAPVVTQEGDVNPNLTYEWRLALTSNALNEEFTVISTEKDLNEPINKRPGNDPYYLWYVVTDKKTGLQYSIYWKLMITSSAGDGLIVADTRDEQTSDVSLIRAKCLSSNYNDAASYKRDGYSAMNGSKMTGLINQLFYGKVTVSEKETYRVYTLTDQTIVALDPETYEISRPYDKLFLSPPVSPAPKTVQNGVNDMFYVDGTELYAIFQGGGANIDQFGVPFNYIKPGSTVIKNVPNKFLVAFASGGYPIATFYDQTQGKFTSVFGFSTTIRLAAVKGNATALNAYDPTLLPNMEAIGSGPVTNGRHLHVLKNKTTADISFYTLESGYDAVTGDFTQSVSKYATTSCPDIANAFGFETCENRDVVYYATPSAVYGAFISGTSVSGTARFTPPSGEKVTCIKLFREAWYLLNTTDETKTAMAENSNQLLVATYNSSTKEGKIYALPITNISGALGTPTADKTFSGFGRITAMATQGK